MYFYLHGAQSRDSLYLSTTWLGRPLQSSSSYWRSSSNSPCLVSLLPVSSSMLFCCSIKRSRVPRRDESISAPMVYANMATDIVMVIMATSMVIWNAPMHGGCGLLPCGPWQDPAPIPLRSAWPGQVSGANLVRPTKWAWVQSRCRHHAPKALPACPWRVGWRLPRPYTGVCGAAFRGQTFSPSYPRACV